MKISYCEVPQGQADPEVMYQYHEVNEDLLYSSEASLPFLMQNKTFFMSTYLWKMGHFQTKGTQTDLFYSLAVLELYILSAKELKILRHHC